MDSRRCAYERKPLRGPVLDDESFRRKVEQSGRVPILQLAR